MIVRPYSPGDLGALHRINEASTPGVSSETEETLARWIGLSTALVATDDGDGPVGFITLIELGTAAYDSANLRWFEARQAREGGDTVYVDRIAVDPDQRGLSIGEALYRAAFEHFARRGEIGCEVNVRPPNPGSERFHTRLGFRKIGERGYGEDGKAVGYWVRPLTGVVT